MRPLIFGFLFSVLILHTGALKCVISVPLLFPILSPMATILLLADEAYGARLKSDLEYIGHQVEHVILSGRSNLPPIPVNGIDLTIIDPESSLDRLAQAIAHLQQQRPADSSLLVITDEMTALNLDFSLGISDFVIKPYSPVSYTHLTLPTIYSV